ncbi:YncE family protein [Lutimonas sp.]|uniref:YncE family protein n=1 Tax=Lutimonas sp. TaxID=1872403 RepID=UPI003D9BD114
MKKSNVLFYVAFLALFISSCSDDEGGSDEPKGDYENGYFVTNEGPFQNGSGTITFVDDAGPVSQNVYKTVNNEDLGNIVNSMYIADDKGYVVVNNSGRVVVVNRFTMEKEAVIDGEFINNPRYFVAGNGKGYISNWGDPFNAGDDFITVISLANNTVLTTIPVGEGPENLLLEAGRLYVCLEGGYNQNNKVAVINTEDDSVESTIEVGDVPNSITIDRNSDIWILCQGKPDYTGDETKGSIYKIESGTNAVSSLDFTMTQHPKLLNYENEKLYYNLDSKIYSMDITATDIPTNSIDGLDGDYYTMNIDNGELYATDAGDFASEGSLKVFNLTSGDLMQTITTGIIPGQVVFP